MRSQEIRSHQGRTSQIPIGSQSTIGNRASQSAISNRQSSISNRQSAIANHESHIHETSDPSADRRVCDGRGGASVRPGRQDRLNEQTLKGIELRSIGPGLATGRVSGRRDRPEESQRLVRRERVRRAVENREPRHHVHADLRRRRIVHAVLRRGRSERLERRLAGHRREHQPAQRAFRRRRLQVHRRREDVEAGGARELGAHRRDPDRPAQLERRLRRVAGTAVVGGRRARPLQDDRRRRHLDARAARQRRHRHQRHRVPAGEARRDLRVGLPAAARGRPDDRRRPGRRHLQDDRRRQEVDEADEGPADRRHRTRRARRRSEESEPRLRDRRREARRVRLLPLGRRGRDVDAHRPHDPQAGRGGRGGGRRRHRAPSPCQPLGASADDRGRRSRVGSRLRYRRKSTAEVRRPRSRQLRRRQQQRRSSRRRRRTAAEAAAADAARPTTAIAAAARSTTTRSSSIRTGPTGSGR